MASISPSESAPELFNWCYERMAYYKAPGWILVIDTFPLTPTQKVAKTKIFASQEDPRKFPGVIDFGARKKPIHM